MLAWGRPSHVTYQGQGYHHSGTAMHVPSTQPHQVQCPIPASVCAVPRAVCSVPSPVRKPRVNYCFFIAFSVVEGQVMSSFCFTVIMTLIIAQALLCWASSKASSLCCDRHLLQILLPTFPVKHCIAFHTDRLGSMRCSNNSRTAWWALSATQTLG